MRFTTRRFLRLAPANSGDNFSNRNLQVYAGISSLKSGSNICWSQRSYAAAAAPDSKLQKVQRRLSKDERQAMVELFVKKYRAMNAGKFPTASNAMKQVGGSYYIVRKILQELEYKSKLSPTDQGNKNAFKKEEAVVNEVSTDGEEVSSSRLKMDVGTHRDAQSVASIDVDVDATGLNNVGAGEGQETSTLFKTLSTDDSKPKTTDDCSNYLGKQTNISKEKVEVVFHQHPKRSEHDVEEGPPSEGGVHLDSLESKHKQHQQSPQLDKFPLDMSEQQKNKQELTEKSSVWGNLKSLADSIIDMWKRL